MPTSPIRQHLVGYLVLYAEWAKEGRSLEDIRRGLEGLIQAIDNQLGHLQEHEPFINYRRP